MSLDHLEIDANGSNFGSVEGTVGVMFQEASLADDPPNYDCSAKRRRVH